MAMRFVRTSLRVAPWQHRLTQTRLTPGFCFCINIQRDEYFIQSMSATKTFRHGQILRLVTAERVGNQEELRRRLAQQKMRVTQATLSRDLHELKLVKTDQGYKTST